MSVVRSFRLQTRSLWHDNMNASFIYSLYMWSISNTTLQFSSHLIFKLHVHLSHRWTTMKTMAGSLCLALALKQLLLNRSGIRSSILNASHFHTQQCVVVFALAVAVVIYILIFLFQFIYLFFSLCFVFR